MVDKETLSRLKEADLRFQRKGTASQSSIGGVTQPLSPEEAKARLRAADLRRSHSVQAVFDSSQTTPILSRAELAERLKAADLRTKRDGIARPEAIVKEAPEPVRALATG